MKGKKIIVAIICVAIILAPMIILWNGVKNDTGCEAFVCETCGTAILIVEHSNDTITVYTFNINDQDNCTKETFNMTLDDYIGSKMVCPLNETHGEMTMWR